MAKKQNTKEEKKGRGRPSAYKPEFVDLAYKFALLGATDAKMAEFFGVDERTLNRWKIDFPDFCQSLKNGKLIADAEIAHSLYHRAKGYSHEAMKFFQYEGNVIEQPYTEHYPPDTGAAFIWLKNRAGWRDKPEEGGDEDAPKPVAVIVEIKDARKPHAKS